MQNTGYTNLKKRLKYNGGSAEGRFINDKLISLKRALLYSYQAATAVLSDNREFRCLINSNKESGDYDNKIISIPYFDICLNSLGEKEKTSEGLEEIGLKCGDVFLWKETNTHWLVYLEYLEEDAYFRAQIRKCNYETQIGNKKYWTYIRGPVETSIPWNQKAGIEWNDINYSLVMYITRDNNTIDNLRRFSKVKIIEPQTNILKTWQVVGSNPYFGDNIIQVYLDEYFENSIEDYIQQNEDIEDSTPLNTDIKTPYIEGSPHVFAFDSVIYTIKNAENGDWYLIQKNKKEYLGNEDSVQLDITSKKGTFILSYEKNKEVIATLNVTIEPI